MMINPSYIAPEPVQKTVRGDSGGGTTEVTPNRFFSFLNQLHGERDRTTSPPDGRTETTETSETRETPLTEGRASLEEEQEVTEGTNETGTQSTEQVPSLLVSPTPPHPESTIGALTPDRPEVPREPIAVHLATPIRNTDGATTLGTATITPDTSEGESPYVPVNGSGEDKPTAQVDSLAPHHPPQVQERTVEHSATAPEGHPPGKPVSTPPPLPESNGTALSVDTNIDLPAGSVVGSTAPPSSGPPTDSEIPDAAPAALPIAENTADLNSEAPHPRDLESDTAEPSAPHHQVPSSGATRPDSTPVTTKEAPTAYTAATDAPAEAPVAPGTPHSPPATDGTTSDSDNPIPTGSSLPEGREFPRTLNALFAEHAVRARQSTVTTVQQIVDALQESEEAPPATKTVADEPAPSGATPSTPTASLESGVRTSSATGSPRIPLANLPGEIAQQIHRIQQEGSSSIQLRLSPENLGDIRLEVHRDGDTVRVAMVSSNPQVREALESQLSDLRRALSQQGFTLSDASVDDGNAPRNGQGSFSRQTTEQGHRNSHRFPPETSNAAETIRSPAGDSPRITSDSINVLA